MMKVKAKVNKSFGITKNKMYIVSAVDDGYFLVLNDTGRYVKVEISDFHKWPENNDTPQIEVGSEWVDPYRHAITVLGVGDEEVFIKNHTMNIEHTYKKDKFLAELKPKPKTVTMYFYKLPHGYVAYSDKHPFDTVAFTKEIEL